jgi:hypothetical protein
MERVIGRNAVDGRQSVHTAISQSNDQLFIAGPAVPLADPASR